MRRNRDSESLRVQSSTSFAAAAAVTAALALGLFTGPALGETSVRVSVGNLGEEGNSFSGFHTVSADGRYVAFESDASNFVPGDNNGLPDVFVRDRQANTTKLLSVNAAGELGQGSSLDPSMSATGRYVAFVSSAPNLVASDGNGFMDIFVRDRDTDGNGIFDEPAGSSLTLVSVATNGTQANADCLNPSISADARFVSFVSSANTLVANDTNSRIDVFVHDRQTGATTRSSESGSGVEGNGDCDWPQVSGSGRFVAFMSAATNLVAADLNAVIDVFVRDRDTDGDGLFDEPGSVSTSLASVDSLGNSSDGNSGNSALSITGDGRFVTFGSDATNLVPNDTNGVSDIFVRDRLNAVTTRVSVATSGAEGVDGGSVEPAISADGHFVAFTSSARNLVPNDMNLQSDIFLHDRETGATTRISVPTGGGETPRESKFPQISATGRIVSFKNLGNLVPEDSNGVKDVYVYDRLGVGLIALLPARGSEAGNELVKIYGCGFTSPADTTVFMNGVLATMVDVTPGLIKIMSAPGTGFADIRVVNSVESATLTGAYTYLAPALAARLGNVNVGLGDRENVLRVNGSVGNANRELNVDVGIPVTATMNKPSSRNDAGFVAYVWGVDPNEMTLSEQPYGLGNMVLPTPMNGVPPLPFKILNNIGHVDQFGVANFPSTRAPSTLHMTSFQVPRTIVVQGIIQDDGSAIAEHMSITNAVIVHIR